MGEIFDSMLCAEDESSWRTGECNGDGRIALFGSLTYLYRGDTECERNPRECDQCEYYYTIRPKETSYGN